MINGRMRCPGYYNGGSACNFMNTAYIQQRDDSGKLSLVKIGYYCVSCGKFLPV